MMGNGLELLRPVSVSSVLACPGTTIGDVPSQHPPDWKIASGHSRHERVGLNDFGAE